MKHALSVMAAAAAVVFAPCAAWAQAVDDEPDTAVDDTALDPMPASGTQPDPRDPNTVIGGPSTFPKNQKPPVPGVQRQGPYSDWDGFYVGAGAGLFTSAGGSGGASVRAGWQSDKLFGFELEYTSGLSEFDVGVNREAGSFRRGEIDRVIAGYGRVRIPVDDRLALFARLGYQDTQASLTDQLLARDAEGAIIVVNNQVFLTDEIIESEASFDGLATGIGAEISINETFGVRAEFTRYDVGGEITLNYIAVGGQVRF